MIEAMIDIGEIVLRDSNLIDEKVTKIPLETKNNESRYAIKIDFILQKDEIRLDIEEISSETANKVLLSWS
ncbi:MAG: hypothetical protein GX144_13225 [Clostridiaceae bacterium]|nr:hypothetical protein [Clostridiaceae bacterium]